MSAKVSGTTISLTRGDFTLAGIWGWPHGNEVAKTCTALTTFLGVTLGISNLSYKMTGGD